LNGQLSLPKIDVAPLERHHFAAPQARLAPQEHDESGLSFRTSRLQQSFEIVEVVKRC
jgi:hypothetical protein